MLNNITKGKLYYYITKRLGMRDYTRGWIKGNCPSCGRDDKYGVNLGLNRTNCFRCGYNPSPIGLVMDKEGLENFNEVKVFLKVYDGAEYLEPIVERVEHIDVVLPEGYKNLRVGNSMLAKLARKYIEKRKFNPEEKAFQGWGYGTTGKYHGYIIIPFYIGGKLIYFNARKFIGNGPKYQNPSIDDFGIGKSLLIYNVDALAIYDQIYLMEGVFNAGTIGDNAIATGGKKISSYQISMFLKSQATEFILLLDPDAVEEAAKVGMKLINHKKVKLIILPGDKDVNDLGYAVTMTEVNKIDWMGYNQLLKIKNDQRSKLTYN